jgi:hypothetical protein
VRIGGGVVLVLLGGVVTEVMGAVAVAVVGVRGGGVLVWVLVLELVLVLVGGRVPPLSPPSSTQ